MERAEAIKNVQSFIGQLTPACQESIYALVPELRESEDERIRKELIEQVGYLIPAEGECDAEGRLLPAYHERVERYRAYLEKQKEQPTDAKLERVIKAARRVLNNWLGGTDCPDVSGDFAELEYAIREYDGEEKQKENPKSADSIQSDCASDVKCVDRWEKAGERLPNTPREVLCKDEAGNYFIGRYYVGEGWEISNYDDDDKPHRLNPPVSKWTDIPSGEQKEQKPAKWSEEDEKISRELTRAILSGMVYDIDLMGGGHIFDLDKAVADRWITWLESLHSRPIKADNWKPSEEQMGALNYAYCELFKRVDVGHNILGPLQNLIDTLSKL